MTLCIAWKDGVGIHLGSDSRISFGNNPTAPPPVDTGLKVIDLPISVFGPSPQGGTALLLLQQRLGVCLVGSVTTTQTVTGALRLALRSVQAVPGYTPVSMITVCRLIEGFLATLAREICASLFAQGEGLLVVVGYCPEAGRARAFEISLNDEFPMRATTRELFQEGSNLEYFGSGASAARQYATANPQASPFHVLKAVIDDPSVQGVGGPIQYGSLAEKDFDVYGVRCFEANHAHRTMRIGFFLGGTQLYKDLLDIQDGGFHIRATFKDPFKSEIDRLLDELYVARDDDA